MSAHLDRYIVTEPLENGYNWFDVADTRSPVMPNFHVASFFQGMPLAKEEAYALCLRLNAAEGARQQYDDIFSR